MYCDTCFIKLDIQRLKQKRQKEYRPNDNEIEYISRHFFIYYKNQYT